MATFEQFNLPKSVQKAIDDLGFTTQLLFRKNHFVVMSGRDMMDTQTGTGKLLLIIAAFKHNLLLVYKISYIVYARTSGSSRGGS
jgi:hypothetical protein